MRLAAAYAAMAMIAIYAFIAFVVGPLALRQDSRISTADMKHPPTLYGTSAAIAAPESSRRHDPIDH